MQVGWVLQAWGCEASTGEADLVSRTTRSSNEIKTGWGCFYHGSIKYETIGDNSPSGRE